ncbi:MAG: preprotein translocase subunit SecE [Clostridiales bacterium]|nr:MAG: preprotein translocase subunit SecE [Clostridiales bacterium]
MGATKKTVRKHKGFFASVVSEMKKVTWPTKKELINFEIVVITFSAIAALTISILDTIFRTGISFLIIK